MLKLECSKYANLFTGVSAQNSYKYSEVIKEHSPTVILRRALT
jgi:hypothetical protein